MFLAASIPRAAMCCMVDPPTIENASCFHPTMVPHTRLGVQRGGSIPLLLSAPYQLTSTPPPASAYQWHGLREAMAPFYASDGRRVDRACLEPERGLAVSGAAVATASGGVSTQRGGKRHGEGACADDVRPHGPCRGGRQE